MSTASIRVVIADDHPIFREGLKRVIERDARIAVVGEAENGETTIVRLRELCPDVAVIDLNMPLGDGLTVLRAVRDTHLATRVVLLTMHDNPTLFESALDLGAAGYVLKDGAVSEIVGAIRSVAEGRHFISPALSTHLLSRRTTSNALVEAHPGLAELTPTERRVLMLIAAEKSSKDIALELFISLRTVEHHRAHICQRLGLRGANALIRFAIANRQAIAELA